jgi:D-alanine transaminase
MPRIAYVNGQYLPLAFATTHIEDRGFQFADSVYDALSVRGGVWVDEEPHLTRLLRSLSEISIRPPMSMPALRSVIREVVRRNRLKNCFVYIQVSRGIAPRDHGFPSADVPPSLIIVVKPMSADKADELALKGVSVITTLDQRWDRCDIKSVGLLPNVLAKQKAREAGSFEAWFVNSDNQVREGSSTNAWIVSTKGALVTRPLDHHILNGITRATILELAQKLQIPIEEREFTLSEASAAAEAFISSASSYVLPVVSIDGAKVGSGQPGPIALRLRAAYIGEIDKREGFKDNVKGLILRK